MNMVWKGVMIICSVCLFALEVISHDYSDNYYIVLALASMLINPIVNIIQRIKSLLEPIEE